MSSETAEYVCALTTADVGAGIVLDVLTVTESGRYGASTNIVTVGVWDLAWTVCVTWSVAEVGCEVPSVGCTLKCCPVLVLSLTEGSAGRAVSLLGLWLVIS